MRVLIIGFFTKSNMPYIENYERILIEQGIPYDVICFNRFEDGKNSVVGNEYTFYSKMGTNKLKKLMPYLTFKRYVERIIRNTKYDKLIVLTTIPAVLIHRLLLTKYKGKFLFDYRDYSFEKLTPYKKLVNKIADASFATFISSAGFYEYVGRSAKVKVVHNISNADREIKSAEGLHRPISIGFVGLVRYFDINTKLIQAFANHSNFTIEYFGSIYDDCDLISFCKQQGIKNVKFHGQYSNEQKPSIYEKIDLINSIYSLSSPEVSRAIPNRLYDALLFKKPIIVADNCFLADVVRENDIGLVLDTARSADEWRKEIETYISSFTPVTFEENCRKALAIVLAEQREYHKEIRNFLNK